MQELIQQVMERAGISEESAIAAVSTVLDFVKQRMPAPLAGQLDQLLTDDNAASIVKAAEGLLGGFFGRSETGSETE